MSYNGITSEEEIKIDTFDMLVGDVGGFYALMWGLLAYLMADFEGFKKMAGVMSDFYSTEDPNDMAAWKKDADTSDNNKIQVLMEKELNARRKYRFEYCDYWIATWGAKFWCKPCCKCTSCYQKAAEKYELFDTNQQRMERELDVVDVIRTLRMSQFNNAVTFKKYQQYFVNKFRDYNLDVD